MPIARSREDFLRFARFTAIGAANTLAYFILANAIVYVVGLAREPATYIAYAAVLPFAFIGHRKITFKSSGNALVQWLRFCVMQMICITIIALVNWMMEGQPQSSSWVGFTAISILIPLLNFVIMQLWVFVVRR